jgi:hypothetical protein
MDSFDDFTGMERERVGWEVSGSAALVLSLGSVLAGVCRGEVDCMFVGVCNAGIRSLGFQDYSSLHH